MTTISRRISKHILDELIKFEGFLKNQGLNISQRELFDKVILFGLTEKRHELEKYLFSNKLNNNLEKDPLLDLLENPITTDSESDVKNEQEIHETIQE
jgi:hypothetical protein